MNTLNKFKLMGVTLINNLIPLLFLIGLTLVNVASYMGFGLIIGLYVTGTTIIIVSLILVTERNAEANKPPK